MEYIDMDCPNCGGTGYVQDVVGEELVCPVCGGTGALVGEEDEAEDGFRDDRLDIE